MTSCDPGDIYAAIRKCKSSGIVVSILGLSAHVHICEKIAKWTKGKYVVAKNENDFRVKLNAFVEPPKMEKEEFKGRLLAMSFPKSVRRVSLCSW